MVGGKFLPVNKVFVASLLSESSILEKGKEEKQIFPVQMKKIQGLGMGVCVCQPSSGIWLIISVASSPSQPAMGPTVREGRVTVLRGQGQRYLCQLTEREKPARSHMTTASGQGNVT